MLRHKLLTTLTAVMAALALAVPVASAGAATTKPAPTDYARARLVPGSLPCQILIGHVRFAVLTRNTALANVYAQAFVYSGCGGAAI